MNWLPQDPAALRDVLAQPPAAGFPFMTAPVALKAGEVLTVSNGPRLTLGEDVEAGALLMVSADTGLVVRY